MTIQFTFPPERFREDSRKASRLLLTWLPLVTLVALFFLAKFEPAFFNKWMASESTGLLEFLNWLAPAITALIAIRLMFYPFIRRNRLLFFWMLAMAVGGIYLAGEEASWGQHYVGWSTPEFWETVNDQQETNLHNTSVWLDQRPRQVLTYGLIVSTLIFPLFMLYKPHMPMRQFDFVYPPLALVPLAAIILATEIYKQLKHFMPDAMLSALRPGELQELYIVWYLLAYAIFLWVRARHVASHGRDANAQPL